MSSSLNSKLHSLLSKLPEIANRSVQTHKHGAVLIKNGRPVAWGFNVVKGNKTWHAEGDAIRRYLLAYGERRYEKQQCILWGCK